MNAKLLKQISDNLTPLDTEELYENMLDDCYGECEIAGVKFSTSRALKELDPTAFRCGEVDYIDSLNLVEIEGGYYEKDAVEAERESLVDELESEISDLRDELGEISVEFNESPQAEEESQDQIRELRTKINLLAEEIEELKNFSF